MRIIYVNFRIGVLDPGGGVGVPPKLDPKLSGSSIEAGHFKPEARAQRDLNRNIRAAAGSDRSTVDSALQNNIPNRSKERYFFSSNNFLDYC